MKKIIGIISFGIASTILLTSCYTSGTVKEIERNRNRMEAEALEIKKENKLMYSKNLQLLKELTVMSIRLERLDEDKKNGLAQLEVLKNQILALENLNQNMMSLDDYFEKKLYTYENQTLLVKRYLNKIALTKAATREDVINYIAKIYELNNGNFNANDAQSIITNSISLTKDKYLLEYIEASKNSHIIQQSLMKTLVTADKAIIMSNYDPQNYNQTALLLKVITPDDKAFVLEQLNNLGENQINDQFVYLLAKVISDEDKPLILEKFKNNGNLIRIIKDKKWGADAIEIVMDRLNKVNKGSDYHSFFILLDVAKEHKTYAELEPIYNRMWTQFVKNNRTDVWGIMNAAIPMAQGGYTEAFLYLVDNSPVFINDNHRRNQILALTKFDSIDAMRKAVAENKDKVKFNAEEKIYYIAE